MNDDTSEKKEPPVEYVRNTPEFVGPAEQPAAAEPGTPAEGQQDAGPGRKKKSAWMITGIVLLIVVGIPLVLAGTCMLIILIASR